MLNFLWLQIACENCKDPSECACIYCGSNMCAFVCVCVLWAKSCSLAPWLLCGWPLLDEGGLCPVISRYSKQTDSPSLKLSLEAWDEMAQIMRHIINHRQGAAGSVYMCNTHTPSLSNSICGTHIASNVQNGAGKRLGSLTAEPEIITQAALWFSFWLMLQMKKLKPHFIHKGLDKSRNRSVLDLKSRCLAITIQQQSRLKLCLDRP